MEACDQNHVTCKNKALFGGSLTIFIPGDAQDVSAFRQVPDNQEVFTHPSSDQSLIVEIMEYVTAPDDNEALKYHINDLLETNDDLNTSEITNINEVNKNSCAMQQASCVYRGSYKQNVSKFNEKARNLIQTDIVLYRLPQFNSDILLTANNPVTINPESSSFPRENKEQSPPWSIEVFNNAMSTLAITNPGVFGV